MSYIKNIKLPNGTTIPIFDNRIPEIGSNANKVLKTNSDGTAFEYATATNSEPLIVTLTSNGSDENGNPTFVSDISAADAIAAFRTGREVFVVASGDVILTAQATYVLGNFICAFAVAFGFYAIQGQANGDGTSLWVAIVVPLIPDVNTNEYHDIDGRVAGGHYVATEINLNGTTYYPSLVRDEEDEPTGRAVVSLSAVSAVRVNGTTYSPDAGGTVNLGSISGGGGGGAATLDVADDNNGNISLALLNTSSTLNVADDNNGNVGISLS